MNTTNNDKDLYKNLAISALLVLWLVATLAGLWWFQQQNVRPFISNNDDARFWQAAHVQAALEPLLSEDSSTSISANPKRVTLLNFWNPSCLCNQLSQRHFEGLFKQFDANALRIITIAPANTSDDEIAAFIKLNGERMSIVRAPADFSLPTSPAVALFNHEQQLGYFGAWGFGALCTVASDDFFPNIVRALQNDRYGPFVNVAGNGCFCAWPRGN